MAIIETAASPSLESQNRNRIEVGFEDSPEAASVVLKYSTWNENLGWCCQKTIRIQEDLVDDLHRALTAARLRINRKRADKGKQGAATAVVQFPSLS